MSCSLLQEAPSIVLLWFFWSVSLKYTWGQVRTGLTSWLSGSVREPVRVISRGECLHFVTPASCSPHLFSHASCSCRSSRVCRVWFRGRCSGSNSAADRGGGHDSSGPARAKHHHGVYGGLRKQYNRQPPHPPWLPDRLWCLKAHCWILLTTSPCCPIPALPPPFRDPNPIWATHPNVGLPGAVRPPTCRPVCGCGDGWRLWRGPNRWWLLARPLLPAVVLPLFVVLILVSSQPPPWQWGDSKRFFWWPVQQVIVSCPETQRAWGWAWPTALPAAYSKGAARLWTGSPAYKKKGPTLQVITFVPLPPSSVHLEWHPWGWEADSSSLASIWRSVWMMEVRGGELGGCSSMARTQQTLLQLKNLHGAFYPAEDGRNHFLLEKSGRASPPCQLH